MLHEFSQNTTNPTEQKVVTLAKKLNETEETIRQWFLLQSQPLGGKVKNQMGPIRRVRFTNPQLSVLHSFFSKKQYVDEHDVLLLTENTNTSAKRIQNWFKHQRKNYNAEVGLSRERKDVNNVGTTDGGETQCKSKLYRMRITSCCGYALYHFTNIPCIFSSLS